MKIDFLGLAGFTLGVAAVVGPLAGAVWWHFVHKMPKGCKGAWR